MFCYLAQADLEHSVMLMIQPLEGLEYRHAPPCQAQAASFDSEVGNGQSVPNTGLSHCQGISFQATTWMVLVFYNSALASSGHGPALLVAVNVRT